MPQRKSHPSNAASEHVDKAVAILTEYLRAPRTALLRQLAEVVVEMRARATLGDGAPDWGGRSHEYRAQMSEVYERAGVPRENLDTIQAALRYHTGNLIRERASKEELLQVGLTTVSPRDRNAANREVMRAMTDAVGGRTPRQDVDRLAVYAQAILEFIDEVAVPKLEGDRRSVAERALRAVDQRASELLGLFSPPDTPPRSRRRGGEAAGGSPLSSV